MSVMPMSNVEDMPVIDRETEIALFYPPHEEVCGNLDSWMNWDPEREQRRWAASLVRLKAFSSAARAVGATSVADALAKGVVFPDLGECADGGNPEGRAALEEFARKYCPDCLT